MKTPHPPQQRAAGFAQTFTPPCTALFAALCFAALAAAQPTSNATTASAETSPRTEAAPATPATPNPPTDQALPPTSTSTSTSTPTRTPTDPTDRAAWAAHASPSTLKAHYLECDRLSSTSLLSFTDAAHCSHVAEALRQRVFGGNFEALLAWWRNEKAAFAANAAATANGPEPSPAR